VSKPTSTRDVKDSLGADRLVGNHEAFPYRSSHFITTFFSRCDLRYRHDGSTRNRWAKGVLMELNLGPGRSPDLPSDSLVRVIIELFDVDDFDRDGKSRDAALEELNKLLARDNLAAYLSEQGECFVRNIGTGALTAAGPPVPRPLTADELAQRARVEAFLDSASEDEFTEKLLVPLFQRFGFHRVTPAGHKEKTLEYGKDIWMKFQLMTAHWLYFCAQVKRGKIDAGGNSAGNAANVLTQVRMAIDHPIFDPDANRKVLLDHNFVIAAGEITRAARNWNAEHLDAGQRRHIIFMDRAELLDHSARIILDLQTPALSADDITF
jgi:hypothetical protein